MDTHGARRVRPHARGRPLGVFDRIRSAACLVSTSSRLGVRTHRSYGDAWVEVWTRMFRAHESILAFPFARLYKAVDKVGVRFGAPALTVVTIQGQAARGRDPGSR
jgi:hypothetical protein